MLVLRPAHVVLGVSASKPISMGVKRSANQLAWDDFPARKEADGWHCRYCGKALTGRRTAWCDKKCLREVLRRVEWRYIRASVLRRDRRKCQICGNWASDVDHIVELADGGSFFELSNLRALCYEHHLAKTLLMRRARAEKKKVEKRGKAVLTSDGPTG